MSMWTPRFLRRRAVRPPFRSLGLALMAGGLCIATLALVWLAYNATLESRRGARLLLEQRAAEQLALLGAGLMQDMKGAQATVLSTLAPAQLATDPPYDVADVFARGFARFPYPESFFAWTSAGASDGLTYVFNRADRPPAWHASEPLVGPYPVVVLRDPDGLRPVIEGARQQARYSRSVSVFETDVAGVPYQVVANFLYHGDQSRLLGIVGFTVNLEWVREVYFAELTSQIARIGGDPGEISLTILDARGQTVTKTRPHTDHIPAVERPFPLLFVDRSLLRTLGPRHDTIEQWRARAAAATGSRLAADTASDSTLALVSLAALAAVVGLVFTARGVRMAAELAAMKSDFVSSVTHELKTPLAVIRLVAETLARGRYDSPDTIRDYANLLGREGKNLTRLIDNLLAYARLSDVRHAYTFEPADVNDLIDDALEHFRALLVEQQFRVDLEVPSDLPPVIADRSALIHALENLIDNAIKYSNGTRVLRLRARVHDGCVAICVADRGIGIRADEIARVCDKFFRGRDVKAGGSGLGLAIARQVVQDHGGQLGIDSVAGQGTRVDLVLPVARPS
jgi:two-component system, OmpR family, phosphate regulon sensor histidine kinase PhoR